VGEQEDRAKRKRTRLLQRYVLNPPVKLAVWTGLIPGYALVETVGRRSGKRRRNVVGMRVEGDTGWVVAEQGRHAGYVANLMATPGVRVRLHGKWRRARAHVLVDDDAEARLAGFSKSHAATVRRFGTDLTTIRFDLAPPG
jgi:deazaflavin-dependent oxidoreductase (nitroreductase family)